MTGLGFEEGVVVNQVRMGGKSDPGRRNSVCKGSKLKGMWLLWQRESGRKMVREEQQMPAEASCLAWMQHKSLNLSLGMGIQLASNVLLL